MLFRSDADAHDAAVDVRAGEGESCLEAVESLKLDVAESLGLVVGSRDEADRGGLSKCARQDPVPDDTGQAVRTGMPAKKSSRSGSTVSKVKFPT